MINEYGLNQRHQSAGSRIGRAAIVLLLLTSIGIFCASCEKAPVGTKNQSQAQRYSLKGKVTSISKPTHEVVVDHEAIPGFMGAMEMPYPVADAASLDKIAKGDEIRADLVVTDGRPLLENIVITKKASAPAGAPGGR
jgi:protein SCO1/2